MRMMIKIAYILPKFNKSKMKIKHALMIMNIFHNLAKEQKKHASQIDQQIASCLKDKSKKSTSGIPKIKDKQEVVMEVVICHRKVIDTFE